MNSGVADLVPTRRPAPYEAPLSTEGMQLSRTTEQDNTDRGVTFVVIVGQGRSGSTLILRLLNQVPGVRISGENYRSLDHLQKFAECYALGAGNRTTDFYKLAWLAPCDEQRIMDHLRQLVISIYGPGEVIGFKEIRYGYESYKRFAAALDWMRQLFPQLRLVFNTRETRTCVRSAWWARTPIKSRLVLNSTRRKFERYCQEHPEYCYHMPYEELRHGSPVLRGMFQFLGLEWRREYEQPLDVVMR